MNFYEIRTFAQNEIIMQDEKTVTLIFYIWYFMITFIWIITDYNLQSFGKAAGNIFEYILDFGFCLF
jgi:hypothetical protein